MACCHLLAFAITPTQDKEEPLGLLVIVPPLPTPTPTTRRSHHAPCCFTITYTYTHTHNNKQSCSLFCIQDPPLQQGGAITALPCCFACPNSQWTTRRSPCSPSSFFLFCQPSMHDKDWPSWLLYIAFKTNTHNKEECFSPPPTLNRQQEGANAAPPCCLLPFAYTQPQ